MRGISYNVNAFTAELFLQFGRNLKDYSHAIILFFLKSGLEYDRHYHIPYQEGSVVLLFIVLFNIHSVLYS